MLHRLALALAGIVAVCAFTTDAATAQNYPTKPIRMIAPFAPGGAPDILARIIGEHVGQSIGQQVVVDNRPGAGGNIASELAARAPADGYTLYLAAHPPFTVNPALYTRVPYDPIKDFAPIALVGSQWFLLAINPAVPARNVQELIAHVKANPGKLSYASNGAGTPHHLGMEFLKLSLGLDIVHVPYRGAPLIVADMVSGVIPVALTAVAVAGQQLKSGQIIPLAVTTRTRSPLMPNVPTIAETLVPDYEVTAWFAVVAPAKTPKPIVDRLNAEIVRTMAKPEVLNRLEGFGLEAKTSTPEGLARIIETEVATWGRIVKDAKLTIE